MTAQAQTGTMAQRSGTRTLVVACAASLALHASILAAAQWLWMSGTPVESPPMAAIPVIDAASMQKPRAEMPAPRKAVRDTAREPEAKVSRPRDTKVSTSPPEPEPSADPEAEAETKMAIKERPAWTSNPPVPPKRPRRIIMRVEPPANLARQPKPPTPDPRRNAEALAKTAPITPQSGGAASDRPRQAASLSNQIGSPARPAAGLANPTPRYPWISRRRGEEGRVVLDVEVTPEGRAKTVRVKRTSGSERLDQSALDAVKDWRFSPARRAGRAVPARIDVPIVFRLTD